MTKAVIFDKDGVLIDSEDTHIRTTVQAFKDFGIKISPEEKKWIVGRSPVDYMPIFAKKYNLTDEMMNEIDVARKKYFYGLLKTAPIFYKTIDLLKSLHKMKIPIALCTQGSRKNVQATLELLGMEDYFETTVAREDCAKRKPDPEPYLVTARKLGVNPEDCLVIEDSEIGLRSALNAKMKCIVIYNKYTKEHNFTGALKVVDSADKIKIEEFFN